MATFSKTKVIHYPLRILKTYSSHAKYKLAQQCLIEKDYSSLNFMLQNMDNDLNKILEKSVERLDLEAVKLIVERAKNSNDDHYKNGFYIGEHLLKELFDKNGESRLLDIENPELLRVKILKILLQAKDKDQISLDELQKLADTVSKQEFEEFCSNKGLDITSDKFKELELSQYQMEGLKPVLNLEDSQQHTVLDLLLSRTFSDKLTLEEIKVIYTNLYNLDPIAQEILVYVGALINQNNNIKIMFGGKEGSYYSPEQNIIKIDNIFINDKVFNTESVTIHEIGHFIYHQLFDFEAMPFDINPAIKFLKPLVKEGIEDQFINDEELSVMFHIIANQTKIDEIRTLNLPFIQYEKAARKPIDKAAELLSVNVNNYEKYFFTQEYTEYLKHNSYIDVFFLNADAAYSTEKNPSSTLPDHVFDNILNVYLANHDKCKVADNPFSQEPSREDIIKWAVEEFLPKLVVELGLSPKQIHFLERIADYINRGEHLLEKEDDLNYEENEKYVELIVRGMEFKAANIGEELVSSFEDLMQFHRETISPSICREIQKSGISDMPFDLDQNNNPFTCINHQEL